MRWRGWAISVLLLSTLLACPRGLRGEDVRSATSELDALRERLTRAEQRLAALQTEPVQPPDSAANETGSLLPGSRANANPPMQPDLDTADTEPGLAERLKRLEQAWKDGQGKAKPAEIKYPTLKIGGRIQLDDWAFPESSEGIDFFEHPTTGVDPEDRFAFRRIRLELEGNAAPTMIYRLQVDFNNPQTPQLKDVYLGFSELPFNQTFIIGNQKRPLGLDQWNSSRFNVFMERPMVNDAFNENSRRVGAAMYGYTDDQSIAWQYGGFLLEDFQTTGRAIGDAIQSSLNARLVNSPWYDESSGGRGYFHWAVAGMLARPDGDASPLDTNENLGQFATNAEVRSERRWLDTGPIAGAHWYEILGLEAMLNIGPLQITSEFMQTWLRRDGGTPVQFQGEYVYVSYFLTGEHIPYQRKNGSIGRVEPFENFFLVERCKGGVGGGWGAWQVAARYSHLDLTDSDILGGIGDTWTLAMNWHWTAHSKLQFDATTGQIRDHFPVAGFTAGRFVGLGTRFNIDF